MKRSFAEELLIFHLSLGFAKLADNKISIEDFTKETLDFLEKRIGMKPPAIPKPDRDGAYTTQLKWESENETK